MEITILLWKWGIKMRIYDAIMLHPTYKKEVLIEFGFGEVSPLEVERWFKNEYPMV